MATKFQFSNVVVVDGDQIGVVVKSFGTPEKGYSYDVYVRSYNTVGNYQESQINHFIYSKILGEGDIEFYQHN